jgi:squalene-hopene/tetraprenyl-beta-curcumene cyclase
LLARPALRRVLGEAEPTLYETGLVDGLRARVGTRLEEVLKHVKEPDASQAVGVEAIFAALFMGREKGDDNPSTQQAWDRLWSMQIHEGTAKGSWPWFIFNSDPYETADSGFFGASLAALAICGTPSEYQARPEIKGRVAELIAYLRTTMPAQPLHNRLLMLWATAKLPAALPGARQSVIDEALEKQQPDGSWTIAALGPWKQHPEAPPAVGANAYATAVAAFALEQAGVPRSSPQLLAHRIFDDRLQGHVRDSGLPDWIVPDGAAARKSILTNRTCEGTNCRPRASIRVHPWSFADN